MYKEGDGPRLQSGQNDWSGIGQSGAQEGQTKIVKRKIY